MKVSSETQPSSSTHSRLIIAICAAGPPQARQPNLRKRRKIAARDSDAVATEAANPARGTIAMPMAKLIYSAIASLDGYIEDEDGNFDWAAPDEEVHRFVNDLERPVGTYLYGRRMYETMVYWETRRRRAGQPPFSATTPRSGGRPTRSSTRGRWRRPPAPGPASSATSTPRRSGS